MQESTRKRQSWRRLLTLFLALAMLAAYVPAAAASEETADALQAPDAETVEPAEGASDGIEEDAINEDAIAENETEEGNETDADANDAGEEETDGADAEEAAGEDAEGEEETDADAKAEEDAGIMPLAAGDTRKYTLDAGTAYTATKDLTADTKEAIGDLKDDGTPYFTVLWSNGSNVSTSGKVWDDGYDNKGKNYRINFAGTASTKRDSVQFTSDAEDILIKIWWVSGGDTREMTVLSSVGAPLTATETNSVKDEAYLSYMQIKRTVTGPENYYIGGSGGKNYIFKIEVTENPAERANNLEDVASPVIGTPIVDRSSGAVTVPVTALVDRNNFDVVTVTMTGPDGKTTSAKSMRPSEAQEVTFNPPASGEYTFTAAGSRFDEDGAVQSEEVTYDYVLPLKTPSVSLVNAGGGSVKASWNVVSEAQSYQIEVIDSDTNEAVGDPYTTARSVITIPGLTVGKTYSFTVTAIRGEETAKSKAENIIVKNAAEIKWVGFSFGPSVSKTNSKQTADAEDGALRWPDIPNGMKTGAVVSEEYDNGEPKTVQVWATENSGKIQPSDADGMMFYYTTIDPGTENFVLKATAHINRWFYSNGQDGFGLMASDSIGPDGESGSYYFNSYMALISTVQYYWNGVAVTDNADDLHINGKLGIGAQEKKGIDASNVNDKIAAAQALNTYATITTLESSMGKVADMNRKSADYNIIAERIPGADPEKEVAQVTNYLRQDLKLVIGKNNTGYYVGYSDPFTTYPEAPTAEMLAKVEKGLWYVDDVDDSFWYDIAGGKWYTVVQYYDTELLSQLNSDAAYIGLFAARNADVTYKDIHFEIRNPDDDPEPDTAGVTYVTPSFGINSASISNSADYRLTYNGNWGGELVIKDPNGKQLALSTYDAEQGKIVPITGNRVEADQKVFVDVTLTSDKNSFSWTMTPDKEADGGTRKLRNPNPVSGIHTVTFAASSRDIIYVAPEISKNPAGTRNNPMALADAIKIAAPGQTIVLKEGTYRVFSGLTIERGISGTPGNYINMIADPEAKTRPIIDFCASGSGMVIAGDYWHLYGFDVTNSKDGDKGIQVSGNNNILEEIWTYRNGNTGIQIARFKASDTQKDFDWPRDNLILNCSSFLNADGGFEDADGFAAKLTVGEGNVFDGCISAFNADDGWDLYAKGETGQIGSVTIKNCIAYCNGYTIPLGGDNKGKVIPAGNGNGFKMGGQSLPGDHKLYNSIAFGNKANGIDCNSCPDIKIYDSTSYNNINSNVSLRTEDWPVTNFEAKGILSYKNNDANKEYGFAWHSLVNDKGEMAAESLRPLSQSRADIWGAHDYYFYGEVSANSTDVVEVDWFEGGEAALNMQAALSLDQESLDMIMAGDFYQYSNASGSDYNSDRIDSGAIYRNENGSINMNGFLELSEYADQEAGARLTADYNLPDDAQPFPEIKGDDGDTGGAGSGSSGGTGGGGGGGVAGGGATAPGGTTGGSETTPTTPPTTVNPEATVSGTTATSTVSESMSSQLVQQAEANKSASVVIEPDMPADVTKADVTVPGKTLTELGEKTSANVTVKTPAGEVTIPHKALEQLGGAENVTMSVETNDGTSTIQISADGQNVEKVDGGIKIAVPLEDGQVVVLVDENGNETILPKSIVEDGMAYAEISGSATIKVIDNSKSFSDVASDSWFNDAIAFVSSHDLFGGVGEGNFDPNGQMNRAMLATVLWRLESKADADSTVSFPDVASGEWYSDGIKWASANGIVKGMDDGTFAPDQAITRETMAVMLYRYAQAMGVDVSASGNVDSFSDGESVSDWARTEMAWAVGAGLLQGDANSLMPGASATRAQVATIIQRFVELIVK